jgi:peptide/nickel transport system ATP-binding protein
MNDPIRPLFELRGITKTYKVSQGLFSGSRPLHALRELSLQINRGEVLGLVGESGCGKSTLAKILLRLETPTSGELLFDGRPFTGIGIKAFSEIVQPIFQDPYSSLNPRKTIRQIVEMPLVVHGNRDKKDRRTRVERMLALMALPSRMLNVYPDQMSGGQRQRVAIARALITEPQMIICDEPTSALDVSVQAQVLNLLMSLRKEFNLTYLFISHDLAVVEHIADRVAVMYLGQVVEEAPVEQIFSSPRHPYTQALLQAILTPDAQKGVPDIDLGVAYPNPIDLPSGCAFHPRCPVAAMPECSQKNPTEKKSANCKVLCSFAELGC